MARFRGEEGWLIVPTVSKAACVYVCVCALVCTAVSMCMHIDCFILYLLEGSAGKESCNAGDSSSIPGSGRSAGEGIG